MQLNAVFETKAWQDTSVGDSAATSLEVSDVSARLISPRDHVHACPEAADLHLKPGHAVLLCEEALQTWESSAAPAAS